VCLGTLQNVEVLFPIIVEISKEEKELLDKKKELLEKFAFSWEDFGPYHVRILRVPYEFLNFDSKNIENLFKEILSDINEENLSLLEDKIVRSLACHSVIRSGNILTPEEMEALVNMIFEEKIPLTCPHGRPFIWEIKKGEIEKYFQRK
ncbi:MAG: DNA mismatch repair protein MutL, partial [Dictyoglomus sp.]